MARTYYSKGRQIAYFLRGLLVLIRFALEFFVYFLDRRRIRGRDYQSVVDSTSRKFFKKFQSKEVGSSNRTKEMRERITRLPGLKQK